MTCPHSGTPTLYSCQAIQVIIYRIPDDPHRPEIGSLFRLFRNGRQLRPKFVLPSGVDDLHASVTKTQIAHQSLQDVDLVFPLHKQDDVGPLLHGIAPHPQPRYYPLRHSKVQYVHAVPGTEEIVMPYQLLADIVLVVHFLFIAFVVAGGFLAIRWPRVAWAHLPCLVWGALIEFVGWVCPLTPLENSLRAAGGEAGYSGGFIEHYLLPVIYPAGLTRRIQVWLGLALLAVNVVAYGWFLRRRRVLAVLAISFGAAACEQTAPIVPTIAIDSAGVQIVTSVPFESRSVCTLTNEPILVIGDDYDVEASLFTSVRGVGRFSDGAVVVADRTPTDVMRVFDASGRHERSFGREGEGPGEFNSAWGVQVVSGDTIWVGDYRPMRYQLFTRAGEWVRTVQLDPMYVNPPRDWSVLNDGRTVNMRSQGPLRREVGQFVPDTFVVEIHRADGILAGVLTVLQSRREGRLSDEEPPFYVFPLFEPSAHMAAKITTIALAEGGNPEVRVLTTDFELRRIIRWSDDNREVTAGDADAWRDGYRANAFGQWNRYDEDVTSPQRPVNDEFPAVGGLMVGVDERIWVGNYSRPRGHPDDRRDQLVFGADGDFDCHVDLPEDFHMYEAGADYVFGIHQGELGVQRLIVYGLGYDAGQ